MVLCYNCRLIKAMGTIADKGYRALPSVDKLLSHPRSRELIEVYSHHAVVGLARDQLQQTRKTIEAGEPCPSLDDLVETIRIRASDLWRASPATVINATGVIVHTNLGRAPLSADASRAVTEAAKGYTDLEMDLEVGLRGGRDASLTALLRQLTGAESAMAVNNNAAALLLALTVLAKDRQVVISRGEAVEIGGGVRIPEVMLESGATLVEVGTTNRTYKSDFEEAITEDTAALLRVHTSNFKVLGFTEMPNIEEVVDLGRRHEVLVLHDIGSGCLLDTAQFGLSPEPMPQASIAAGADLVFFSGDKLLGGPQAGIIVGRSALIDRLRRQPLARPLRIDKLTMAALTTTLVHYVKEEALDKVPVWRMVSMPVAEIEARAFSWLRKIGEVGKLVEGRSTIGGGSLPGETLPTKLLAISPPSDLTVDAIAKGLRLGQPPVIGRIDEDLVLLDPRTVSPEEDDVLVAALVRALGLTAA